MLLLYSSWQSSNFKLLFRSDKDNKKKVNTIFDIYQYRSILGNGLCNALLFIHAFSGCDTTSQFHKIGKGTAFDIFAKNSKLALFVQTFMSLTSTHQDIEKNGENAVLLLYKANQGEPIIGLRKRLFLGKLAKAKCFVKPERLPPTCSSLRYHSFRTYYTCNCASDCSTLHCGCRKGIYPCSSLCGKCQINECTNVEIFLEESEIDIDSETNFDLE